MFGMGFMEILFIAVIAIIFLGPEKLPEAMVEIARFFRKIKGTIANTKEELEKELQLSELKAEMLSYKSQLDDMTREVKDITSGDIVKKELSDINKTIHDAATMPQTSTQPTPSEPKREVVTFEKKKTPIVKPQEPSAGEEN